jgi:hypothetical protein
VEPLKQSQKPERSLSRCLAAQLQPELYFVTYQPSWTHETVRICFNLRGGGPAGAPAGGGVTVVVTDCCGGDGGGAGGAATAVTVLVVGGGGAQTVAVTRPGPAAISH